MPRIEVCSKGADQSLNGAISPTVTSDIGEPFKFMKSVSTQRKLCKFHDNKNVVLLM